MNWLAHLYLATPDPDDRLGSLLPDMVAVGSLGPLPPACWAGIARHREIDAFTDAHPSFRRSVGRFAPPFRRYGGVLVDVLYDHFLTLDWEAHAREHLDTFAGEVYLALEAPKIELPGRVQRRLDWIREVDLLCSYATLGGVERAFGGLSRRLRRSFDLAAAVPLIEAEYDAFQADFRAFFPALRSHLGHAPPAPGAAPGAQ